MKYALGVDVGGTKISVTLGSSRGKILARKIFPVRTGRQARQSIKEITETLGLLAAKKPKGVRLLGIGVGIPGPMDPARGIVERSPHLRGWEGFPLKAHLERKLRLPVRIANDANAAALGEKIFGQSPRVKDLIYLTVSTGIGGGIISEGRLLWGASSGAGEVGHTIIVPEGERCGCGHRGCLEAYASGTAIASYVRAQIRKGRKTRLRQIAGRTGGITAETAALAAAQKDRLALEAFRRAGYYLGIGLANLINLFNPEVISLGGSVMKSARFLWPAMRQSVRCHAWPSLYKGCRIVKTRLGGRVGDLGALALVFARTRGRDI